MDQLNLDLVSVVIARLRGKLTHFDDGAWQMSAQVQNLFTVLPEPAGPQIS